jgi:hypothetical protein
MDSPILFCPLARIVVVVGDDRLRLPSGENIAELFAA